MSSSLANSADGGSYKSLDVELAIAPRETWTIIAASVRLGDYQLPSPPNGIHRTASGSLCIYKDPPRLRFALLGEVSQSPRAYGAALT
jgi:hypothetical protein